MKNSQNEKGLTLIELVVVIVFLTILMLIATPMLRRAIMRANDASAAASMRVIGQAENNVFLSTGKYWTLEELKNNHFIDETIGNGT